MQLVSFNKKGGGVVMLTVNQSKAIEEYWVSHTQYKKDLDAHTAMLQRKGLSDYTKDARYNHLKKVVDAISYVTASLDEELKEFTEIRYLSEDAEFLDWDDVADALGVTRSKAYKLRSKLIAMTAKKLGWK